MRWLTGFARACSVALFACSPLLVSANELLVGLASPITSLDPHYHNLTPNISIAKQVFEPLFLTDQFQNIKPGLAESWRNVDPLTYEIKLRKGVKWHDGSPFVAEDVLATIKRVPDVPNSPASFALYVRQITEASAPDPQTLVLKTAKPYPGLIRDLNSIQIIPKAVAESAKTEAVSYTHLTLPTKRIV